MESAEAKARRQLHDEASKLFASGEYDKLDRLAGSLRRSKEYFSDGFWKLSSIYGPISDLPGESTDSMWTNRLAQLTRWMQQKPESITARVALAEALANYAWKARGGRWASEVTETGWKLFHERLAESAKVLQGAKELKERCPRWYVVTQRVALGEGWPRDVYEKIFSEATQFEPDYAGTYLVKAYYLLPRWYGQEGEWEKYAMDVANQRGGEDGDVLYAWIVWYLHDQRVYGNIFKETKVSWARVKKGFEVLERRYPESLAVPSELCYLSGQAGDRTLMKELFAKLDSKVDVCVWEEKSRFIKDRQWAFSR